MKTLESFKYEYVTIHSVKEEAERWWKYSESDVKTAKYLFEGKKYKDASFYCQQAVEKLLKAVVVLQTGQRPPRTHDLQGLAEQLPEFEIDEAEIQAIASVDAFYVGSRYPLDSVDPSVFNETVAKSAVEKVDTIFLWFLTRINFGKE